MADKELNLKLKTDLTDADGFRELGRQARGTKAEVDKVEDSIERVGNSARVEVAGTATRSFKTLESQVERTNAAMNKGQMGVGKFAGSVNGLTTALKAAGVAALAMKALEIGGSVYEDMNKLKDQGKKPTSDDFWDSASRNYIKAIPFIGEPLLNDITRGERQAQERFESNKKFLEEKQAKKKAKEEAEKRKLEEDAKAYGTPTAEERMKRENILRARESGRPLNRLELEYEKSDPYLRRAREDRGMSPEQREDFNRAQRLQGKQEVKVETKNEVTIKIDGKTAQNAEEIVRKLKPELEKALANAQKETESQVNQKLKLKSANERALA